MGQPAGKTDAFRCLGGEHSDAQSHVGRELGDYRLMQLIGEGGMGWVYLARHSRIGRRVAIKMLRPELANDPVAVRRFFEEARAVNRIQHENIVQVHDFVENDGGTTYLVLELLVGQDLLSQLDGATPLPLGRALAIMSQVAKALGEVHDCSVVHRDLKPENIFLVDRPGQPELVKLLDFGIAKLRGGGPASRITRAGTSLGTPDYIAPEQALGADVDHRADIYSFGVILYELVTGRRPFASDDVTLTIARQVTEVPVRPRETRVIPTPLDDLIMRCMAKRPGERPQSMGEVDEKLRAIIAALEHPGEPAALTDPAPRIDAAGDEPARNEIVLELGVEPGGEARAAEPRVRVLTAQAVPAPRSTPRRFAMAGAGLAVLVVCALALRRAPVETPASAEPAGPAASAERSASAPLLSREDAITTTAGFPVPEAEVAPPAPPKRHKRSGKTARPPGRTDILPVYQD
jgi:tRNA A-37 threonylcarbamoyl transferase component Bud32